jgi:plasmid stabilization system protein ParE
MKFAASLFMAVLGRLVSRSCGRPRRDLKTIGDYIAKDSPAAVAKIISRIFHQTDMLAATRIWVALDACPTRASRSSRKRRS